MYLMQLVIALYEESEPICFMVQFVTTLNSFLLYNYLFTACFHLHIYLMISSKMTANMSNHLSI